MSLRIKQAALSSLVFLASVTVSSVKGRVGNTISSDEEMGSKYLQRVAVSLGRARKEGITARVEPASPL